MTRAILLLSLAASLPQTCFAVVAFDWAYVGNPGNAGQRQVQGTFGAVAYNYAIATHEVTNAQYVEFLNAVAAADGTGVYDANMTSNLRGGISRAGTSGNFTYSSKPDMADKPVNFVSYLSAMRFVNWLHNGQSSGGTESGVYQISNGLRERRSSDARYWIPSENEWYKAAYYQPPELGGDFDGYWSYPTSTNSIPTVASANDTGAINNPGPNVVNYANGADWNLQNGNLTSVGSAGPASANFYGLFDVAGNVWEMNEASIGGAFRGMRGGSFNNPYPDLEGGTRGQMSPTGVFVTIGFRIATLPEPTSLALAAMLAGCGMMRRRTA